MACLSTNYIPVKYQQIVFGQLGVIVFLALIINGGMIYLLKKRATLMSGIASNSEMMSEATANARKITFFVTGNTQMKLLLRFNYFLVY